MGRTCMTQPEKLGVSTRTRHVEGVAVVAKGAGDEAVVAGIVDGGVEVTVETEDVQSSLSYSYLLTCPHSGISMTALITSGLTLARPGSSR